jgi:hypothetical protein
MRLPTSILRYFTLQYVRAVINPSTNRYEPVRDIMTGYLMSLNGGPISWKSSRQGGVTLSSSEAEFVAASQVVKR